MSTDDKIPTRIIGLLSGIFPDYYTHNEIDTLFLYADAPELNSEESKPKKIQAWLRLINLESPEPLKILGSILDDFLEKQSCENTYLRSFKDDPIVKLEKEKDKIREALEKIGLTYSFGGHITKGGAVPTRSLN